MKTAVRLRPASFSLALASVSGMILSAVQPVFGADTNAADSAKAASSTAPAAQNGTGSTVKSKEDPPPFPVAGKISRTVQTVTGVNFLTSVIAGQVAGAVIRHKVGGKAKVKVKIYSLTDLVSGKIKSVDVRLQDSKVEGVELPKIHVATKNPVWYQPFKGKDKKRGLNNPIVLSVQGEVNQKDVEEALTKQEITNALSGLKLDIPGLGGQELEVLDPKVDIETGKICINGTLVTRGAKPDTGVPITISANPKLINGTDVILDDMKVQSPFIEDPENFAKFVSDLLNPIVRLSRYDRKTHAFRLTTLDVSDQIVKGEGNLLLVPKDYKPHVAKSEKEL